VARDLPPAKECNGCAAQATSRRPVRRRPSARSGQKLRRFGYERACAPASGSIADGQKALASRPANDGLKT
jgi:hypothetical protein